MISRGSDVMRIDQLLLGALVLSAAAPVAPRPMRGPQSELALHNSHNSDLQSTPFPLSDESGRSRLRREFTIISN